MFSLFHPKKNKIVTITFKTYSSNVLRDFPKNPNIHVHSLGECWDEETTISVVKTEAEEIIEELKKHTTILSVDESEFDNYRFTYS